MNETLPASAEDLAERLEMILPDACVAGVEQNLRLLAQHIATLRGRDEPERR